VLQVMILSFVVLVLFSCGPLAGGDERRPVSAMFLTPSYAQPIVTVVACRRAAVLPSMTATATTVAATRAVAAFLLGSSVPSVVSSSRPFDPSCSPQALPLTRPGPCAGPGLRASWPAHE
jgi:hypothetical protein